MDSSVRAAVRRGAGSGRQLKAGSGIIFHERLSTHEPRQTLDTPEHRWIPAQLDRIVRRLGQLQQSEAGYDDAYRDCLDLSLGPRIEVDPLHLSAKRISLLHEYWCYLALLRLVSEVVGAHGRVDELFSIRQQGLHVLLEKGRKTTVPFDIADGRKISVSYNARFQGDSYIFAQKLDLPISFEDPNWHPLHLLLDAKYRVEGSPEYKERYGTPGPPEDAINVLHLIATQFLTARRVTCATVTCDTRWLRQRPCFLTEKRPKMNLRPVSYGKHCAESPWGLFPCYPVTSSTCGNGSNPVSVAADGLWQTG
jgi:hypothetical protein